MTAQSRRGSMSVAFRGLWGAGQYRGASQLMRLFWRSRRGQALLETALVFAILPFLFLGVSDFSEADLVLRRIDEAAGTSADLVARLSQTSSAELDAMKDNLLDEMIKPYPPDRFGLVITCATTDASGTTRVTWSHGRGNTVGARAPGTVITLPQGMAEPSQSIILAETSYRFSSTLSTLIIGTVDMRGLAYSVPRLGAAVQLIDQ